MYKNWKIKKWDTPFSDQKSLIMESLVDDGDLKITLAGSDANSTVRWEASFKKAPAYRNILEEYRLSLWEHLDDTDQRMGNSFFVENSLWIKELLEKESLLDINYANLNHYVIVTESDVVEVLSDEVPEIVMIK